ncbi:MAG: hypothetical protein K2H41_13940 [Acetatifactor sp.]|nr:hypothetical protein [Acetatifactor sp.]
MNNIQGIISRLASNDFSISDLEQYLESSLVLIKVNAIIAVLREHITEESIICKLNYISQNIQNEPKVIGEWNTGHFAIAVLNLLNTKDTRELYNNNIKKLDVYAQQGVERLSEQISIMLEIDG